LRLLGVETRQARHRNPLATGDLFALRCAPEIAIGPSACFISGLADDTYGKPTKDLPWGRRFGDSSDGIQLNSMRLSVSPFSRS